MLKRTVDDLRFSSTNLDDCFAGLAQKLDVPIDVRWDRLRGMDVDRDQIITARIRGLSGDVAIRLVMYLAAHDVVGEANRVRGPGLKDGDRVEIEGKGHVVFLPLNDLLRYEVDRDGVIIITTSADLSSSRGLLR